MENLKTGKNNIVLEFTYNHSEIFAFVKKQLFE